jgi:predicted TPR repeat methyltransferase
MFDTSAADFYEQAGPVPSREVSARIGAVLARLRAGQLEAAAMLAGQARADGLRHAALSGLLGHTLSCLGRHDAALAAYAESLHLAPDDGYVRHLLAAAGRVPDPGRAVPDYVRTVFDGYALRFDAHLLSLGYRVPGLFRRVVLAGGAALPRRVLDLGCGTGLLAVALSDRKGPAWVGVDVSPRMLGLARQRGLYAELHEADLLAFLDRGHDPFALAFAGDVLPYFGDLAPLLRGVAPVLAPGGRVLVSVESLPGGEAAPPVWELGRQGRYRHAAAHVRHAAEAAGLVVTSLAQDVLRWEREEPVPGLIGVLMRPAS